MLSRYNGVKFYGVNDWSIAENLEKAVVILETIDTNTEYTDINQVIELYNIQELFNSGVYLKKWDEKNIDHYKQISNSTTKVIGKFFGKISDGNFFQLCQSVCIEYIKIIGNCLLSSRHTKMYQVKYSLRIFMIQKQHFGYCCSKLR
ncbi:hypothetical protein D7V82_19710 [bacterium 1xD8-6]|nr:hypothetical protein D7V72_20550 [bacterium D16-36]RKI63756.1 hypothetical protein D7V82_19710 [bacterium 1xD8-6]